MSSDPANTEEEINCTIPKDNHESISMATQLLIPKELSKEYVIPPKMTATKFLRSTGTEQNTDASSPLASVLG